MRKIQQDSFRYRMLYVLMGFAFKRFFKEIEVRGLENIPLGEPVIFAPNHQSGLVDPLLLLFFQNDSPIVFMARADIFKNKLAASLLRFLKIMPVFRIRDGFENLGKNEERFNEAKDVLLDSKYLCLMPEGNHGHQHTLRPLVKGLFRIAFSAQEALPEGKNVFIVPVGIDHSYFQHAGASAVISFGTPIRVDGYMDTFKDNPALAMNGLRTDLANHLSALMHDIRSEERYDLLYTLSCLGVPAYLESQQLTSGVPSPSVGKATAGQLFDARKTLGKKLDELDEENNPLLNDWEALLRNMNQLPVYPNQLVEWMEKKPSVIRGLVYFVVTLFALPGMLLNTPAWLINNRVCRSIKDKQMHNTFAFAVGFVLNPLIYIALGLTVGITQEQTWLLTLANIFLIGLYGLYCERWRQRIRLPFLQWKFNRNADKKQLVELCKTDYFFLKQSIKQWISTWQA